MPRALKTYSVRDNGIYLPSDVTEALGLRSHIHSGDALIWATTAKAACEHVTAVGLPTGLMPKHLQVNSPEHRAELKALRDWPDGTVLVLGGYNGKVAELRRNPGIGDDAGPLVRRYTIHPVGHYTYTHQQAFIPVGEYAISPVTDAMVSAALDAFADVLPEGVPPGWLIKNVRTALEAALRAQAEAKNG